MKRYILQTLDGQYCCDATKESKWEAFTPNIQEAKLYTKKEAKARVKYTMAKYIRITVLIDKE